MGKRGIFETIICVVFVAAIGFSAAYVAMNWDKLSLVIYGKDIYLQSDIDNAYEDGYNAALEIADECLILIDEHSANIVSLGNQIASLNTINNNHLQTISGLQNNITELSGLIAELELDDIINQSLINQLENQVSSLQNQMNTLLAQINQNLDIISLLINRITELEGITKEYDITFVVDGVNYSVQTVVLGGYVDIPSAPIKTGYEFKGWSFGGNLIYLDTYIITADIEFIAEWKQIITATLSYSLNYDSNAFTITLSAPLAEAKIFSVTVRLFNGNQWAYVTVPVIMTAGSIKITDGSAYSDFLGGSWITDAWFVETGEMTIVFTQ